MIITTILALIFANATSNGNGKSIFYSRITLLALICSLILTYNNLYVKCLHNGIVLYSGFLYINSITLCLTLFILFLFTIFYLYASVFFRLHTNDNKVLVNVSTKCNMRKLYAKPSTRKQSIQLVLWETKGLRQEFRQELRPRNISVIAKKRKDVMIFTSKHENFFFLILYYLKRNILKYIYNFIISKLVFNFYVITFAVILAVLHINKINAIELFEVLYTYIDKINTLEFAIILSMPSIILYGLKILNYIYELNLDIIPNKSVLMLIQIYGEIINFHNNYRYFSSIVIGTYNALTIILFIYSIINLNLGACVIWEFFSFVFSFISICFFTYKLYKGEALSFVDIIFVFFALIVACLCYKSFILVIKTLYNVLKYKGKGKQPVYGHDNSNKGNQDSQGSGGASGGGPGGGPGPHVHASSNTTANDDENDNQDIDRHDFWAVIGVSRHEPTPEPETNQDTQFPEYTYMEDQPSDMDYYMYDDPPMSSEHSEYQQSDDFSDSESYQDDTSQNAKQSLEEQAEFEDYRGFPEYNMRNTMHDTQQNSSNEAGPSRLPGQANISESESVYMDEDSDKAKKEARLKKRREARANMTPEQKKAFLEKEKGYDRKRKMNWSEEKKNEVSLYQKQLRQSKPEDELKDKRKQYRDAFYSKMDQQEKRAYKAKHRKPRKRTELDNEKARTKWANKSEQEKQDVRDEQKRYRDSLSGDRLKNRQLKKKLAAAKRNAKKKDDNTKKKPNKKK